MQQASVETCWVEIHLAGDLAQAKQVCRAFCLNVGLCVTVRPQTFIYTGGEEEGVVIGLVNYPRFPSKPEALFETAERLAEELRLHLCQHSYLLLAPDKTKWVNRRDENPAAK